jgi:hypothetical protein
VAHIDKEPGTGDALTALRKCHSGDTLAQHLAINSNTTLWRK